MEEVAVYEFKVPSFLMSALVNDDKSGFDEEDEKILDKTEKTFFDLTEENEGDSWVLDYGEDQEPYFTWNPDFINLGCDVLDCKLYILKGESK